MTDFEGYFSDKDADAYKNLVAQTPHNGVIVETGIFKGLSTKSLCEVCLDSDRKIIAIDSWSSENAQKHKREGKDWTHFDQNSVYQTFLNNMKEHGYDQFVSAIRADSHDIAEFFIENNCQFDLILLDALHHYEFIKKEINLWLKCLIQNGIIGGHDYETAVKQAVDETFGINNVVHHPNSRVWSVKCLY